MPRTVDPGHPHSRGGPCRRHDSAQVVELAGAYRELLVEMGALGRTEAVVCTSFNHAGEPLVYTPIDALRSARSMGLDVLTADGWMARLP